MANNVQQKSAKIIAIMNNKGGPGKTSSATNLAVHYARSGKRTLLMDSDQQANTTEVAANGKKYYSMYGPTICDLYSNARLDIHDVIVPAMAGDTPIPNLDLVPSDPTFEKIIEQTLTRSHREKILARHLEKIRDEYEYIIIDCAPGLNIATGNAIYIADHVLVPVDGGSFSLSGLEIMLDYMDEISEENYSRFSVFRNNYNAANKKINTYIESALTTHERISPRLLKSRIRTDQAIVQSQVACVPLYYYQKSAMALVDYAKLARELDEIISSEAA
ncbi:chromosome partitioning protein ParA [Enterobacter cloacae subsp. cloacae]|uniref:ParA family protein n=1 Tax=Enterobacter TaxID=547 RepID=UPI00063AA626|nr:MULTISPECIES: ParA family protein [Enterobacter]MCE1434244.1 ParA family protein [Enterobacter hormaechei]KLG06188.1 chromosome partitioning protein ParA [Enterobacter cloacae subsp. cloacae]MCE1517161.1 ParA family protein [Enterobacter hormaechei]MCK6740743.1 ParA family protein [Enterobacter bugandensis]RTN55632.1 ParA family protein [Enterobacter ludwigii]